MNIRRAALHEAGHAVMHAWLRMENLDRISLIPDPKTQSWGRCMSRSTATPDYPRWRLAARKRLLFRMAGGQAELLFPRARVPGNSGDWEDALKLSGTLFPQSRARALRYVLIQEQRARRLVRGVLRTPILEFADILQQRVEIGPGEAHDILMRLLGIDDYWDRLPQRRNRTRGTDALTETPKPPSATTFSLL
jgi:hypothetical protein